MRTCDQCNDMYQGNGAGISYSHTVGLDGKPLSGEPLPPNRHFCSKLCLDRWDAEHSDGFPTQPPGPLPPGLTLHAISSRCNETDPHRPHPVPGGRCPGVTGVADDDGSCLTEHPSAPGVLCGRVAGHGPGDMHDSGFFGGIPHLWPNPQP